MIKKFKEFNETFKSPRNCLHYIMMNIKESRDELEDQFLRLKEVYDCGILINSLHGDTDIKSTRMSKTQAKKIIGVLVYINPNFNRVGNKNRDKIMEELSNVKNRIESIYDPVNVNLYSDIIPGSTKEVGEYFRMEIIPPLSSSHP